MTISDTDLQALIDAEAKATKGEWRAVANGFRPEVRTADMLPGASTGRLLANCGSSAIGKDEAEANATLIAALRNAAPSILAELRASREIIAKLPKTADGVPMIHGQTYFYNGAMGDVIECESSLVVGREVCGCPDWACYSTREAAIASKGER